MLWWNLNIEIEKSEQTVFAQIFSISILRFLDRFCAVKRFKNCKTFYHAELSALSIACFEQIHSCDGFIEPKTADVQINYFYSFETY